MKKNNTKIKGNDVCNGRGGRRTFVVFPSKKLMAEEAFVTKISQSQT